MSDLNLNDGGVDVVVLRTGNYNGADHKTLGRIEAGETIRIAGSQLDDLRERDFVCLPEDFDGNIPEQDELDAETQAEIDRLDAQLLEARKAGGDKAKQGESPLTGIRAQERAVAEERDRQHVVPHALPVVRSTTAADERDSIGDVVETEMLTGNDEEQRGAALANAGVGGSGLTQEQVSGASSTTHSFGKGTEEDKSQPRTGGRGRPRG